MNSLRLLATLFAITVLATATLNAAELTDDGSSRIVVQGANEAVSYTDDTTKTADDENDDVLPIPEPSTLVLFAASAAFAVFMRALSAKKRASENDDTFLSSDDLVKIRKAYRQYHT